MPLSLFSERRTTKTDFCLSLFVFVNISLSLLP